MRVRRSPKILSFLLAGAVVGAIVALVLTFAFPPNAQFPASQVFGFLLLIGVAVGGAAGGLVALVLDRALQRRARVVPAVHEVTPPAPIVEADPVIDEGTAPEDPSRGPPA